MKNLLLLSVAALPLLHPSAARAETTITDTRTAPVATATAAGGAPDDVTVAQAGVIRPAAAGPALILNSNNKVTNRGTLEFNGLSGATGISLQGGFTGSVENAGAIRLVEDFTPADADKDGDLDGPFAQGTGRFGIRLAGPGGFTGSVSHLRGGSITVEGNNSGGIVLDGALTGALRSAGTIAVTGDNSVGLAATSVSGDVSVLGSVAVAGEGAAGVRLGTVGGRVLLQSAISATGYRATSRPADKTVRDKLDADDLKQGGPAVSLSGNIAGGVLLDRAPADTSSTDTDEDKDGVPDADESNASLAVAGGAPALDIGGLGDMRIGVLGTGDNAFGLLSRGGVSASGVYDGVSATAVRIGRPGGGATIIDGGVRLAAGGALRADAFEADSTALLLNAGAQTPVLLNERGSAIGATLTAEGARTVGAVVLEAGAALPLLRNGGEITAALAGEKGTAAAIVDRSGTLSRIENTGVIRAAITATDDAADADDADADPLNETVTGRAIAIDLRANTTGATLVQTGFNDGDDGGDKVADPDADGDGVDDADEPSITGDILLGSGADVVELRNGTFRGALAFGAGEDRLLIDGGAQVRGALSDGDGRLAVDLRKGRLELTPGAPVQVSSLDVSGEGVLAVTLDPASPHGGFKVSGNAALASGAQIDVTLTTLLTGPASFRIVDAATLQTGTLDAALAGTPFLYTAGLRAVAVEGDLFVDVRRRTAAELGLNTSQGQAYDAVSASLGRDDRIERAVLARTDREGLIALYDQLLPDHSGGSIMSAAAISSSISAAVNAHSGVRETPGATGVWAQQIQFRIEQDKDQALGYESKGFGFAAGVEEVAPSDSAVGLSAALVFTDYNDQDAAVGEQVSMTFAEVGVYGRWVRGGFRADARLGGGYVAFDSDRRVASLADDLNLETGAEWNGWLVDAHLGAAYEQSFGAVYMRPSAGLDYVHLNESGYDESGGGAGVDLAVESRSGSLLTGNAALALGARFGDADLRWGPEVTVGWRQRLAGDVPETVARFRSGGPSFTLNGEPLYDGGLIGRVALKGVLGRTAVSVEGGLEQDDDYSQYDVRAVIRFSL